MEIPTKRRYRLGETRYVGEILGRFYPDAIQLSPVRLGTLPEPLGGEEWAPEERALLTTRMRWADALAIEDGTIHLIEAKLLPAKYPEGTAKLELYRDLIPHTKSLFEYLPAEILPELWTPIEDAAIMKLCHEKGIRNPIFKPDWFDAFITSWFPRDRRSPRFT